MEESLLKALLEQGTVAVILTVILVFLGRTVIPRFLGCIDALRDAIKLQSARTSKEHQASMLIMLNMMMEMQAIKARYYGLKITGEEEMQGIASDSFRSAASNIEALREQIELIYKDWDGEDRRASRGD